MCTGMEAIALGSALAGTAGSAYNKNIQNDTINAQNAANQRAMAQQAKSQADESVRQRAMEDLQAAEVTKALVDANPESVVEEAIAVADDPNNAVMAAFEDYNTPDTTGAGKIENKDVQDSAAGAIAAATRRTRGLLRNASLLTGQDAAMNSGAQALTRMGSDVQTIGSNRQGSSNVARVETSVPAATVRPSNSALGDILMIGGGLGSAWAGSRIPIGGGTGSFQMGNIFNKKPLNAIPALGKVNV